MNNQSSTQSPKTRVVQKARYFVLVPFIVWLIFSIWVLGEVAFPRVPVQGVTSPSPNSNLMGEIYVSLLTLWILGDILFKKKRSIPISIEQKSSLPFLVGVFLLGMADQHLQLGNYVFYLALALTDVLPIVAIVVGS